MIQVIREEILEKDGKIYLIQVTFDGEQYTATGYTNNILINETSQPADLNAGLLKPDSPEIENLIFLLKDDINEHGY